MARIIVLATAFGSKHGGINAFNEKLCNAVAALGTQVTCIVPVADLTARASASTAGVNLLTTGTSELSAEAVSSVLPETGSSDGEFCWIGHDRVTGHVAADCRHQFGGSLALIHHMNFGAYTDFKWGGEQHYLEREQDQRRMFAKGDVLFGVGPLLVSSLKRLVDPSQKVIVELVPGLDNDLLQNDTPPTPFRAVIFGRLGSEDDPIKQGRLAIAALSAAVGLAHEKREEGLLTELRPEIDVVGLKDYNAEVFRDIQGIAELYSGGMPWPLPRIQTYTEDRAELKAILRNAHVAIMPSWHEGFGLVGWEAIGAAVPLLISRSTGLFQLISNVGKVWRDDVASFHVVGQIPTPNSPESFTSADVLEVAKRFKEVAAEYGDWKARALRLREKLSNYTWENTAKTLVASISKSKIDVCPAAAVSSPIQTRPEFILNTGQTQEADHKRDSLHPTNESNRGDIKDGAQAGGASPAVEATTAAHRQSGAAGREIDALIDKANELRLQDKFAEARSTLDQASRLLGLANDLLRSGRIAASMGRIERIQGNPALARQYFQRALSDLPDTEGKERAFTRLQLGIVLRQQDDRSASRRELQGALDEFRRLPDRDGEGEAALELAELHRIDNRPCCIDRSGIRWGRMMRGVSPSISGYVRAIQSQRRSSPSHPEAASPGDELGGLRRGPAAAREPDGLVYRRGDRGLES